MFVFFVLVVGGAGLASASLDLDDLNSATVGYWTFDENTGTTASDSKGSNTGTANNARVFTSNTGTSGIVNSGADFTQGDDFITTSSNLINPHTMSSRSASVWFNKGSSTDLQYIINERSSGGDSRFYIATENNNIVVYVGDAGFRTISSYTSNEWHHVVLQFNSGTATAYVNGELEDTFSYSTSSGAPATNFALGSFGHTQGGYFNGFIDEVAIFDRALTSDEVSYLYAEGSPGEDQQYEFSPGEDQQYEFSPNNFVLSAVNFLDNESLTNWSVEISNSSFVENFSTVGGNSSIFLNESQLGEGVYNLTFMKDGTHFRRSYTDVNLSLADSFEAVLGQVKVGARDVFSEETLDFNIVFQNFFINGNLLLGDFEQSLDRWNVINTGGLGFNNTWSTVGNWSLQMDPYTIINKSVNLSTFDVLTFDFNRIDDGNVDRIIPLYIDDNLVDFVNAEEDLGTFEVNISSFDGVHNVQIGETFLCPGGVCVSFNDFLIDNVSLVGEFNRVYIGNFDNPSLDFFNDSVGFTAVNQYYFNTGVNETLLNLSNYTVDMVQATASFSATQIVTGEAVTDFNITILGETYSFNETFNISSGVYSATFSKAGYYDLTKEIQVSPLTNHEFTFQEVYDNKLFITVKDFVTAETINNFTINIKNEQYGFEQILSTTNSTITFNNIKDLTYNINITNSPGWFSGLQGDQTITTTGLEDELSFTLFKENSIYIELRNLENFELIDDEQINLTLTSEEITYNFQTSNGTYYATNIIPSTYKIRAVSPSFENQEVITSISSGEAHYTQMYLEQNLFSKLFTVRDNLGNNVQDALLTFKTNVNGSVVTVKQATTDLSGRVFVGLNEDREYTVVVTKTGFTTFTGNIIPTQDSYAINIQTLGSIPYQSIFIDVSFRTDYNYNALNNDLEFFFDVHSSSGSIQDFSFKTFYDGVEYNNSLSGSNSGGIIFLQIDDYDPAVQRTFVVEYTIKASGYDELTFTRTFFISTEEGFAGSVPFIRDLVSDLPDNGKVFLSMFIILMFAAIGVSISRDFLITGVVTSLGVGFSWYLGLISTQWAGVSLISLFILIIGMGVSRSR